jgi:DNA-directed RNA polymerase specialized sigma subunit
MTAKEYLSQAYRLEESIKFDLDEVENLRDLSRRISACGFDERFKTSQNSEAPFVKVIVKITELEEKIKIDIDRSMELRRDIQETIKKVQSSDERTILWCRYIKGMKWGEIVKKLCVDKSTVTRWHQKALKNVSIIKKL